MTKFGIYFVISKANVDELVALETTLQILDVGVFV